MRWKPPPKNSYKSRTWGVFSVKITPQDRPKQQNLVGRPLVNTKRMISLAKSTILTKCVIKLHREEKPWSLLIRSTMVFFILHYCLIRPTSTQWPFLYTAWLLMRSGLGLWCRQSCCRRFFSLRAGLLRCRWRWLEDRCHFALVS